MFSVTRLKWLMNRSRSMGSKELVSRLFDAGRHGVVYATRWRLPLRARRWASNENRNIAMPHADWHIWHLCPEAKFHRMAQADCWLQQRVQLFGVEVAVLGDRGPRVRRDGDRSEMPGPALYSGKH